MTISAMRGWNYAAQVAQAYNIADRKFLLEGFSVRLKSLLGISMLRAQNRTDIRAA
jgi:hypothetical protein